MTEKFSKNYEALRKEFHAYPELSGREYGTQTRIIEFLSDLPNCEVKKVAQTGVLGIFQATDEGPTVLIRADIDALPIEETNDFEHRSNFEGISHKCGHDGHTTMGLALAKNLSAQAISSGKVIVLFQPSEENGKGAASVMEDEIFGNFQIDWVFALHNLPGFELNTVLLKSDAFTAEVKSMAIYLKGFTAHAAEPEKGKSPSKAIADLLNYTERTTQLDFTSKNFVQITPVHATLGERAYGVSPGYGEVHLTLRSWSPEVMKRTCIEAEIFLAQLCENEGLTYELEYLEEFSANMNHPEAVEVIRVAATTTGCEIQEMNEPFRWGEDFGLFTQKYKGAMFGLGAGLETPPLHHPAYDFPDAITPQAQKLFRSIIDEILT